MSSSFSSRRYAINPNTPRRVPNPRYAVTYHGVKLYLIKNTSNAIEFAKVVSLPTKNFSDARPTMRRAISSRSSTVKIAVT